MTREDYYAAVQELVKLESDGYELDEILEPDGSGSLDKWVHDRTNLFRILGRIDCRRNQINAVNNFGACYGTGLRQEVDGETGFTLAKCFKIHLNCLIQDLDTDLKVSRTWNFWDRRLIKWVDRWEDVCEDLKIFNEETFDDCFPEE